MLLLTGLLTSVACAPPPYDTSAPSPGISITWPPAETEAMGCTVVTADVLNFEVIDPAETDGKPHEGQGHYHVVRKVTPPGYTMCTAPFCIADFSDITTDQQSELQAVLVGNDHQPLEDADGQPIQSTILFSFKAGECALSGGGDSGATW